LFTAPCTAQFTGHSKRYSMDFGWRFTKGDIPHAESPRYDDSAWRHVDVPHDWSIEGPWKAGNPSGSAGGYATIGIGWYRKTFTPPASMKGKQVYLDFDGVFDHADVWINGQKVARNGYGYIGFQCDLTPWIRPGRKNVIAVRVDNLRQASRWYTGSGIFRHVWLYATGPLHIPYAGTCVTTPKISAGSAQVRVQTLVVNDGDAADSCKVETALVDPHGKVAVMMVTHVAVGGHDTAVCVQQMSLPHPVLWQRDDPALYKALSIIGHAGHPSDTYQTTFGVRTLSWDVDHGFSLNGKRVIIKGVCLHHDLGALGAAAYDRAIERRLLILKSMDVNAVRLSHNPYSPEMLQLCDSLGILVFDECFDKWYGFTPDGTGWKKDLSAFVRRDRNHPSVIIWSVGNEMTPHMYTHWGTRIFRAMKELVHALDARPVTAALHPVRTATGKRDAPLAEIASFMDVISMNYQTRFYPRDHTQHPRQVLLGSETHVNQRNLDSKVDHADGSANQWFGTRNYFTNKYYDYVGGQFIWAGFDYLGEAGPWPSKGSRKNLISTTGFRKPISYYIQTLYTDSPMVRLAVANPAYSADREKYDRSDWLALSAHWNWPPEYDSLRVYTFSNAPEVELLVNGKSLGTKRLKDYPQRIIDWEVPNSPGTLKAVAKKDGKVVASWKLQTTGPAVQLKLSGLERLKDNGEDISSIEVDAVDAAGRRVPEDGREVHFTVEGAGSLAGVDNGDLDSPEAFQAHHRQLRDGRCLVLVKSGRNPGVIKVTARAEGLRPATKTITVRKAGRPAVL
jgi:beta-galactosidase